MENLSRFIISNVSENDIMKELKDVIITSDYSNISVMNINNLYRTCIDLCRSTECRYLCIIFMGEFINYLKKNPYGCKEEMYSMTNIIDFYEKMLFSLFIKHYYNNKIAPYHLNENNYKEYKD